MVNEINSVGVSPAQGLGRAADVQISNRGGSGPAASQDREADQLPRFSDFSMRANAKDQAAQVAQSVRDAGNALGRVDQVLKDLKKEVQMVKNYPPFPPGNEQRLEYIKGLSGLRKELDALMVPPVKDGSEPVFYPSSKDLPELDPKKASDKDVHHLGQAVDAVRSRLNESFAELQAQVDALPRRINSDLPLPVVGDGEAGNIGADTGHQLTQTSQPLSGRAVVALALGD
jgi:hypothetical protein